MLSIARCHVFGLQNKHKVMEIVAGINQVHFTYSVNSELNAFQSG